MEKAAADFDQCSPSNTRLTIGKFPITSQPMAKVL